MYLFDTDTLSNIVKQQPSPLLIGKLRDLPKAVQYTSAVNIGEIYYGAYRSPKKDQILEAFERHVFPNINILAFDEKCGKIFGILKADIEKRGIGCSEPDLRIASVAICHNLTIVTGNTRHFGKLPGLRIQNWLVQDEGILNA